MDELERLRKEAADSLNKYVKLNDEYRARFPKAGEDLPRWVINLEELEELDNMGKAVNEALTEWNERLCKYIERRAGNK